MSKTVQNNGGLLWALKQLEGSSILTSINSQLHVLNQLATEGIYVTALVNNEDELIENEDVHERLHFLHRSINDTEWEQTYSQVIIEMSNHTIIQLDRFSKSIRGMLEEGGSLFLLLNLEDLIQGEHSLDLSDIFKSFAHYFRVEDVYSTWPHFCLKLKSNTREEKKDFDFYQEPEWIFPLESLVKTLMDIKESNTNRISVVEKEIRSLKDAVKSSEQSIDLYNITLLQQKFNEKIQEEKSLKQQVNNLKQIQKSIEKDFKQHEGSLLKFIQQQEKNIRYFQKRVGSVESSYFYKVGKMITAGIKNPAKSPYQIYKISRFSAGTFLRKLKRKKKNIKPVPLPYKMESMPNSFFAENAAFQSKSVQSKVNDLFLIGRYDTPNSVKDLKVACIFDEFSLESFKHDCTLVTFRPDNWYEVLIKENPQLLIVESAWFGNGGAWQYKIGKYNTPDGEELDELLQWCKENSIPTIFWNKEDPIHFEKFIDSAKKFDYIFTSDENCIEKYKQVVKHDNVFSLPFAAQPAIHNPIQRKGYKSKGVCFAGSYYGNRHIDRKNDQEELLDASMEFDLDIYDRNYQKQDPDLQFPDRFSKYIIGSLPYHELVKEYKKYKVFLNVNSVQNSGTMFSRRVFELLASGTTVISTYADGITKMFNELVPMVNNDASAEKLVSKAIADGAWRREKEIKGQRLVFNHHTYAHRLYNIAEKAGLNIKEPYQEKVTIFALVENQKELDWIVSQYTQQEYKNKCLYVCTLHDLDELKLISHNDIEVIKLKNTDDFGEIFKELSLNAEYISMMSPDNYYGPHYLEDIMHGFIYSQADIVGKNKHYTLAGNEVQTVGDREEVYVNSIVDYAYVMKKSVLDEYELTPIELVNGLKYTDYISYGVKAYATNRYNFISKVNGSSDVLDVEAINL